MSEATTPKLLAIGKFLLKHGVLSGGVGAGTLVDHTDSDAASAQEFVNDLEALGPTFIKLGQLLSTRSDLIPPHYIDSLRRLQDAVDPVPIEDIKTTIEEELGADLRHMFAEFEEDPQASGSLAQVHRATLRDGTPVAVKVQRPGIKRRIYGDISALKKVVGAAERVPAASVFNPSDTLDQFRRSISGELDFLREAHSLIEFQDLMDDFDLISVPKPYLDYTTSRVLTMDYVDGKSILDLGDLGRLDVAGEALADQLINAYLRQVFVEGFVHADPHPGNLLITDDGRLNIIDLGMTTPIEPAVRRSMLALVLASVSGDSARAGRLLEDLGEKQETYDKERFRDALSALIGEYLHAPPGMKKPGRLLLQVVGESAACGLSATGPALSPRPNAAQSRLGERSACPRPRCEHDRGAPCARTDGAPQWGVDLPRDHLPDDARHRSTCRGTARAGGPLDRSTGEWRIPPGGRRGRRTRVAANLAWRRQPADVRNCRRRIDRWLGSIGPGRHQLQAVRLSRTLGHLLSGWRVEWHRPFGHDLAGTQLNANETVRFASSPIG